MEKSTLAAELIQMAREDLSLRAQLAERGVLFGGYHPQMRELHDANARRLEEIISLTGWPFISLVGAEAAHAAWLVLQHAISHPRLQRACLALLRPLAKTGEANPIEVAMLEDRICSLGGEPQRYGTQFDWDDSGNMSPVPMEDASLVNARREVLGLPPLTVDIARKREELKRSGERAPADLEQYKREKMEWLQSVGWRKA